MSLSPPSVNLTAVQPLLSLRHLHHRHGPRDTVIDFSLNVQPGSICCLLGPSGCGKTTVLRCIAGFEPLHGGEIRIGGDVVSGPGLHVPAEKRRVGMVFQDHALFPHLSVLDNVAFGTARRASDMQRARALLDTVNLSSVAHRFPHELSGGQQQRVALARALAPEPRLLLLDEPFSNLDLELREQLALEVRSLLKAGNTTAIFVTHDQHEAFAIADEIAVMKDGRLQQLDSAYQLYHQPANRFVADFVGQGVFVRGTVLSPHRLALADGEFGSVSSQELLRLSGAEASGGKQVCIVGSTVDVLLRPDDVIHDDASPVQATVLSRAFLGAEFLYTLRLRGGSRLLALVPSHHNHAVGENIGVRLLPDHLMLFDPAENRVDAGKLEPLKS
jgi:iron(III) transport system ATP-binding protein